mmetsp:Transcript_7991/g.17307  ORF Transcript_7991/g.17307 Transcript_7991/m.17307 type:complete len:80 (-) Transcript_7991:18-257(-)
MSRGAFSSILTAVAERGPADGGVCEAVHVDPRVKANVGNADTNDPSRRKAAKEAPTRIIFILFEKFYRCLNNRICRDAV